MPVYGWYTYTRPDGSQGRALRAPTFAQVRQSINDLKGGLQTTPKN